MVAVVGNIQGVDFLFFIFLIKEDTIVGCFILDIRNTI